jgi:hypothetical protein
MQNKTSEILLSGLTSLGANVVGVVWVLSWLGIGGLGMGMSSAPTAELNQLGITFAGIALCCPVTLNLALVGWSLVRRRPRFAIGWVLGLVLSGVIAGCFIGLFVAYLAFLDYF